MRLEKKTTATLLIAIFMISAMVLVVPALAKKGGTTIQDGTLVDTWGNPLVLGFDEYGYNYQAHMFNGWYWNNQRPLVPFTDEQSLMDAGKSTTWLIMKWSDSWLSNMDHNEDGKLDKGWPISGPSYTSSAVEGAWLTNHQFGSYWDIEGEWVLEFDYTGTTYNHEMTITSGSDVVEGTGSYPAGGPTTITWTVTGSVTSIGNVNLVIKYDGSTYEVTADGKISEDGNLGGTWTSNTGQAGTWLSTKGSAEEYKWNYFVKIVYPGDDAVLDGGIYYTAEGVEIGTAVWGAYARILQVYNDQGTGEHGVEYNPEAPTGFGYYKP